MREPSPQARMQALEQIAKLIPDEPLDKVGDVNTILQLAPTLGTLISPVALIDFIPQMHAVSFGYVFMNWTVEKYRDNEYPRGDVYFSKTFCKPGDFALSQQGILALWRAAGGRDVSSVRTDDGADPLHAEFEATVAVKGIDGKEVETIKRREVDLRPGSPEATSMGQRQLEQAKQMVARNAETKAQLRAIRSALGLRQSYSVGTLDKPFILPTLRPQIDTSDPVLARLVGAHALGVVDQLYGKAEPPALPAASQDVPGGSVNGDGVFTDATIVAPDASGYDEMPPEDEGWSCLCPCGCGAALEEENAAKSTDMVGAPRCLTCFPGKNFDAQRHANVGDLQLPKRQGMTATDVIEWQRKKAGAAS